MSEEFTNKKVLYRFEDSLYSENHWVEETKHFIVRETEYCFVIKIGTYNPKIKYILKDASKSTKRFAYEDRDLALHSYIKRKQHQVSWLKFKLQKAQDCLKIAQDHKESDSPLKPEYASLLMEF